MRKVTLSSSLHYLAHGCYMPLDYGYCSGTDECARVLIAHGMQLGSVRAPFAKTSRPRWWHLNAECCDVAWLYWHCWLSSGGADWSFATWIGERRVVVNWTGFVDFWIDRFLIRKIALEMWSTREMIQWGQL